jgi:hypothetical protein
VKGELEKMDSGPFSAPDSCVPGELFGPVPRNFHLTASGTQMVAIAVVAFTLAIGVGGYGLVGGVQQIEHRAKLRRDGRSVVGTVSRLSKSLLTYTFDVDGVSYTGRAYLPERIHLSLDQLANYLDGHPIPIRYLPQNPSVNHPAAWEWPSFQDLAWFLFPLFFGPLGILLVIDLRRSRQLVSRGTPASGIVTKSTRGRKGGFLVAYEFRTRDGGVVHGSGGSPSDLEIGSRICVLYLSEKTKTNQPYPTGSYVVDQ